jgi:hypothetical protein
MTVQTGKWTAKFRVFVSGNGRLSPERSPQPSF